MSLAFPVTAKSIQDRYTKLKMRFHSAERKKTLMSGLGDEVGELEALLSGMREAREDLLNIKEAETVPENLKVEWKEEVGKALMKRVLGRKKSPQRCRLRGRFLRQVWNAWEVSRSLSRPLRSPRMSKSSTFSTDTLTECPGCCAKATLRAYQWSASVSRSISSNCS